MEVMVVEDMANPREGGPFSTSEDSNALELLCLTDFKDSLKDKLTSLEQSFSDVSDFAFFFGTAMVGELECFCEDRL